MQESYCIITVAADNRIILHKQQISPQVRSWKSGKVPKTQKLECLHDSLINTHHVTSKTLTGTKIVYAKFV